MSEIPDDLVPLGLVHNDENRGELMNAINEEWRHYRLKLWGYEGEFSSPVLKPVPTEYAIHWMGGPGRENGNNTDYPGVAYYCDVTAFRRLREHEPDNFVLHAGWQTAPVWTQVRISERALDRVRREVQRVRRQARPTDAELDEWMLENAQKHIKRDLILKACCQATGATVRDAAAAFRRAPTHLKLARGKKPSRV